MKNHSEESFNDTDTFVLHDRAKVAKIEEKAGLRDVGFAYLEEEERLLIVSLLFV